MVACSAADHVAEVSSTVRRGERPLCECSNYILTETGQEELLTSDGGRDDRADATFRDRYR